jgi:hypothetical protein
MKNKVLLVLTIASIAAAMPVSALYGQEASKKVGGELTPDIAWNIENGVLRISGNGVIPTTMFGNRSAWHDYKSLFHSVVLEEGITDAGRFIFNAYKNITSLTIGGSVKDLAPNSFSGCKKLSVVEVRGAVPPDINLGSFYGVKFKKAKLIVPSGTKAIYEADPMWNRFGTIAESAQPAVSQLVPTEALSQPCTIYLTRTSNFVGAAMSVQVFLNGVEKKKLGNGQTISFQTTEKSNMLFIGQGENPNSVRRFEAISGGEIRIEYSIFNSYMIISD